MALKRDNLSADEAARAAGSAEDGLETLVALPATVRRTPIRLSRPMPLCRVQRLLKEQEEQQQ